MLAIAGSAFIELESEPSLLRLRSPLVVIGDVHGQFFDLLNLLDRFGAPPKEQLLFLGDYVDRGKFCIEVMTLVLVLKLSFPDHVHLLRGNHEGRTMTSFFNFKIECTPTHTQATRSTARTSTNASSTSSPSCPSAHSSTTSTSQSTAASPRTSKPSVTPRSRSRHREDQ